MRIDNIVAAALLLSIAGSTVFFAARVRGADAADAPRPAPVSPNEQTPLPAPDELDPGQSPLSYGDATQNGGGASPCPAAQTPCARGGCRRDAPCGQTPFGASVNAAVRAQICNGLRARMVLYHYDFCDGDAADGYKLNWHGMTRLRELVRMFERSNFHPIVIEDTPCNPQLDAARREYVVKMLGQMNAPVPETLVVVAKPEARALSGDEATYLHKSLMKRIENEGKNPPPSPSSESADSGVSGAGMPSGGAGAGR